jgi:hypothetical protein
MYPRFHNLGKVCALVIAPLVLPFIAFAGKDNGKGNDGKTTATKRETILLRKLLKQTQPGCWFPSSARFYSSGLPSRSRRVCRSSSPTVGSDYIRLCRIRQFLAEWV